MNTNLHPRDIQQYSTPQVLLSELEPDNEISLDLGQIAYENFHGQVFHAWLNSNLEQRRERLRDRYVFLSVSNCIEQHLSNLLTLNREKANEFVGQLIEQVRYLAEIPVGFTEEWFKGINFLVDGLSNKNYIPEARLLVAISLRTGVAKFPGIAQSLNVHAAFLEALIGRRNKSAKLALRFIRKPYLLPNRRDLPKLYHKLMYILSASNHLAEYREVIWKGASSQYAPGYLRDIFIGQIVKTYRGAFRAILNPGVPLMFRIAFLLANVARIVAATPGLKDLKTDRPIRWLHLSLLHLIGGLKIKYAGTSAADVLVKGNDWRRRLPSLRLPRVRKILITRAMGGIGDLMMMTPGLLALRKKYPKATIDFAIPKSFHSLLLGMPEVNVVDINEAEIVVSDYDMWINLTDCPAGRAESRQAPNVRANRIVSFAKAMRVSKAYLHWTVGFLPYYKISDEERSWALSHLTKINPTGLPVVGIQPFSADRYKNWPHMEMLASELAKKYCVLVFHHEKIPGYNHENIHQLVMPIRNGIALLGNCECLVAVDSSFVHISAALGIRSAAVFGPTSGKVFCRYYKNVTYFSPEKVDFPCYPCWRNEHKPCHLTNGRESICLRSVDWMPICDFVYNNRGADQPVRRIGFSLKKWLMYGQE